MNCTLAPIEKSMNDSRDILSGREDVLEVHHLCSNSVLGKPKDLGAESTAPETVEQGPGTLPPTAPATTASPAATTSTITAGSIPSGILTECTLAALSTQLGQ